MLEKSLLEQNELVTESIKDAISYAEYRVLVENHANSFTSTGHTQTEALSNYTVLNDRRMRRWDKTLKIAPALIERIQAATSRPSQWLVLTESWCGDAAPGIPVMNALAEQVPHIELGILLRDDNPRLMDAFLTNGTLSIPKLVVWDVEAKMVMGTWGPRPAPAARLVAEAKAAHGHIPPEFKEDLQQWYNKDKGQSTARELVEMMEGF